MCNDRRREGFKVFQLLGEHPREKYALYMSDVKFWIVFFTSLGALFIMLWGVISFIANQTFNAALEEYHRNVRPQIFNEVDTRVEKAISQHELAMSREYGKDLEEVRNRLTILEQRSAMDHAMIWQIYRDTFGAKIPEPGPVDNGGIY